MMREDRLAEAADLAGIGLDVRPARSNAMLFGPPSGREEHWLLVFSGENGVSARVPFTTGGSAGKKDLTMGFVLARIGEVLALWHQHGERLDTFARAVAVDTETADADDVARVSKLREMIAETCASLRSVLGDDLFAMTMMSGAPAAPSPSG